MGTIWHDDRVGRLRDSVIFHVSCSELVESKFLVEYVAHVQLQTLFSCSYLKLIGYFFSFDSLGYQTYRVPLFLISKQKGQGIRAQDISANFQGPWSLENQRSVHSSCAKKEGLPWRNPSLNFDERPRRSPNTMLKEKGRRNKMINTSNEPEAKLPTLSPSKPQKPTY